MSSSSFTLVAFIGVDFRVRFWGPKGKIIGYPKALDLLANQEIFLSLVKSEGRRGI